MGGNMDGKMNRNVDKIWIKRQKYELKDKWKYEKEVLNRKVDRNVYRNMNWKVN